MKTFDRSKTNLLSNIKENIKWFITRIAVVQLLLITSCGGSDAKPNVDSSEIAKNAGVVVKSTLQGKYGPVYVFEEYHNARIGQIQIATMLTRLYHSKNLRTVGLEGAVQGPAPLPTEKFLATADPATRRDVLKRLLHDAEISGTEYAGASLAGLKVVGIEDANEYSVQMTGAGNGAISALLQIAEKKLPQSTLVQFVTTIKDETIPENKRRETALNVLKAADPWLKARFETLENQSLRLPDLSANNKAIINEARRLGITLSQKDLDDMESAIRFYEIAEKRSDTMADNVTALAKSAHGQPVAMIIGAAHTDRVVARLEKNGVSTIVLRPLDFKGDSDKEGLIGFANKSKGLWANDTPDSLGSILNAPSKKSLERKPPPLIGNTKRDGYASAQAAAMIAAKAARAGGKIPDSISDQLKALPGITVDLTSFKKDGNDVIFAFETEDTAGKTQKIWVRTGTKKAESAKKDPAEEAMRELETAEAGGGKGDKPPGEKPKSGADEPSGQKPNAPGKDRGVSITGRDVQMKFFKSASEAERSAMISDV